MNDEHQIGDGDATGGDGVRDKVIRNGSSKIMPTSDILPIDAIIIPIPQDTKVEKQEYQFLAHATYLLSLAVFGIAGVMTRYGLKVLSTHKVGIGHSFASDKSFLYPDLVSNMIGSFLMGWLGVVFKRDISNISDQLAVGLSTGFLGCLTTFSGWNQSTLNLSAHGRWGYAVLCVIIGLVLSGLLIVIGVWTAKICKRIASSFKVSNTHWCHTLNKSKFLVTFFTMLLVTLMVLWGVFVAMEIKTFRQGGNKAEVFLGGLVGPFGVWLRWYLSRLNGRGFGRNHSLKWMPFGTLAANVLASCIMAAMAILSDAVNGREVGTVASGIQLGLLGSLSTVSTFMSELYEMGRTCHPLRVVAYVAITILPSLALGTLIYSVPVWVRNYQ